MDGAHRRALAILIAVFAIAVAGAGRLAVPAAADEQQPVAAAPPAPPPVTQAAVVPPPPVPSAPPVAIPTPTATFPAYTPRPASRSTYRPTIRRAPSSPEADGPAARDAAPGYHRPPVSSGDPRSIARAKLAARGWSGQFSCLDSLWTRESGWRTTAANPSGAYGIPQALPGSKMASAGSDWRTNPATQIDWGLNYIASQYGSPCGAWSHFQSAGSY